jgi:phospholipid/cholesterol/gamma-HCH transport system permease protein
MLSTLGELTKFTGAVIQSSPGLRKYSSEVLRQAAIIILSSGFIIWIMEAVMGGVCGVEANYTLKMIGAPLYSGVFNAYCSTRICAPYMWGYIFAAKIGSGLVAELGSMRISDEIDALEVMGIPSRTYLVASRVAAVCIAMPFLYIIGLGVMNVAEYAVTVSDLGAVSSGGYLYVFWLYQNAFDLLGSMAKALLMGIGITIVGCYYGFTAKGGPVGVGQNAAKAMMMNMVLIHLIGLTITNLFWGLAPNAPIGN